MQCDFTFMRTQPVLPQIDALPRAQREAGAGERNRELDGGQRGANVSRHVIGTFVAMTEEHIAIGHEAGEETLEVAAHVGIGIFLNDEARRGVANEERADRFRCRFPSPSHKRVWLFQGALARGC